MKKLLLILFVLPLFLACSSDDEPTQDYTSFTITWVGGNSNLFSDYKTGYFDNSGKCILLFNIEQLSEGVETKEYIMPSYQNKIYLFYVNGDRYSRLEEPIVLKENRMNKIVVPNKNNPRGIPVNPSNDSEYPH